MDMAVVLDITKAMNKLAATKNMRAAGKFSLTEWAGQTVKHIRQRRILKSRSGTLMRNIGYDVTASPLRALVGTGVGRAKPIVYATVHEDGMTIRPRYKKALTIPFPGVKGVAANFPQAFLIVKKKGGKKGAFLVERTGKGRLKYLFRLVKKAEIPARGWFSTPLEEMEPVLQRVLSKRYLLSVAAKLTTAKTYPKHGSKGKT